jgi:hypothetical protein
VPKINDVQYPRIPSRILKGALSMKWSCLVVKTINDEVGGRSSDLTRMTTKSEEGLGL